MHAHRLVVCSHDAASGLLKEMQLDHGGITVEGTPRRIVIMVSGLATQQQQVLHLSSCNPDVTYAFASLHLALD